MSHTFCILSTISIVHKFGSAKYCQINKSAKISIKTLFWGKIICNFD